MDYKIGNMLKQADIGLCGERISFIHCGHAADVIPDLIAHLHSIDEPTLVVNKWARSQLIRLSAILAPHLITAIDSGHGIAVVERERFLEMLERVKTPERR